MRYILAIDQGTTSSRAVVINPSGKIVGMAQKEFTQYFPEPGWVEHNPQEIWSTQVSVISEVVAHTNIDPSQIHAIGITNQRETTVVWNKKTGKPLGNAIVWQDRRTTSFCEELKSKGHELLFQKKTGLLLDPYFSGTKVHWILNHFPGAKELAKSGDLAFGTIDTWLTWNLTEGKLHITDVTNASRTLLFNIHTLDWDDELLEILEIPKAMLPKVHSSSENYGMVTQPFRGSQIPLCGIAGDQQAALFGQMCTNPGMVKSTYGTGCFLLMNTGKNPILSQNKLLTTIAYQIGKDVQYALEGSVFNGGTVIAWLKDELGLFKHAREVEKLASSVESNEGVYFVPAFTGLGAPYWNPHARGTLLGITRGTKPAHIARAALEGIAYQVADLLHAMEKDSKLKTQEIRVDGGMVANNLLMQFQADIMNVPIIRPKVTELTAVGAAYLAGLASGFWENMQAIQSFREVDLQFTPKMDEQKRKSCLANWSKAITTTSSWSGL